MTIPSSVVYYPGYSQVQVQYNYVIKIIKSITNALQMVVTTTENSNYVPGITLSFQIPPNFGMTELNELLAEVVSVSGKDITTNLDSTSFRPFFYPSNLPKAFTPPLIIPAAQIVSSPKKNDNNIASSLIGTVYNNGTPGNPVNGL